LPVLTGAQECIMTKEELIAIRQAFVNTLLSELTVRNTVLLETLVARSNGQNTAMPQDGILRTVALLEGMKARNQALFQGHSEAQMLADGSALSISKRTLQEWEQGRRAPSGAAQTLIRIARRHPEVVREALA
jgi:hypothetical protein